jgi:hypothetical protein
MTAVLQQEMHQKAVPKKAVRELKHLHTTGRNKATSASGCFEFCATCLMCNFCACGDCNVLPPDP